MIRRLSPLAFALLGVGAALVVVAFWWRRPRVAPAESALDATIAVRITRHDELGMPSKPLVVRERGRVHAIVEALGVDAQPPTSCPPDYASADVGLLLSGTDVYARRNVYVWGLTSDAGTTTVLVTTSAGCHGGPAADPTRLRELVLRDAPADGQR